MNAVIKMHPGLYMGSPEQEELYLAYHACKKSIEQLEPEGEVTVCCGTCQHMNDGECMCADACIDFSEHYPITTQPPQQPSEGEIPKCPHENTFVCMRHCNTDSCGFHPNYQ